MSKKEEMMEYEVVQDGLVMASAIGPESRAWKEALNYAAQYSDDGEVIVFKVTREKMLVLKRP